MSEISIVPFRFKYFPALVDMLESQEYPTLSNITMKSLPKVGYIALLDGHIAVAAGFLRKVEGRMAIIDGLVSNAFMGSIIRHEGLQKILDALLAEAKDLKIETVIGMTKDAGILKRVELLGFVTIPYVLLAMPIPKQ